jgi:hypothetical protein
MAQMEMEQLALAEQQVQQGSDIVVIPYSAYMEPDGTVRMSEFTRMAAQASLALYQRAATADTMVVAVGEHTYGTAHTSTTELIYDYLRGHDVPEEQFPLEQPVEANSTPQQIDWLQRTFGPRWHDHAPVLVGLEPHWKRIKDLCELYRLPSNFVDAAQMLDSVGKFTAEQALAAKLFAEQNARYEATAQRIMRGVVWLGPVATTRIFSTLARLRSPTVVDIKRDNGQVSLYATHSRAHRQSLQRSAA